MNKKYLVILMIFCLLIISVICISSSEIKNIKLVKGKNIVRINTTNPFYVKTLIELNPKIEAISFNQDNKTIGYVNVFKGVGKNFAINKFNVGIF